MGLKKNVCSFMPLKSLSACNIYTKSISSTETWNQKIFFSMIMVVLINSFIFRILIYLFGNELNKGEELVITKYQIKAHLAVWQKKF